MTISTRRRGRQRGHRRPGGTLTLRSAREASTTVSPSAVSVAARPDAEGDDQQHAERDLALGDRAEQHDERGRAGDQPGGRAHREQPAHARLLREVAVAVVVAVIVVVAAELGRTRRATRAVRGSRRARDGGGGVGVRQGVVVRVVVCVVVVVVIVP